MKKFILAVLPTFVGLTTALLVFQMLAASPVGSFDFVSQAFGDTRFTKYKISSSSSGYSTTSTSTADVTNLSVTIVTTGRPVQLLTIPSDGTNLCRIIISRATNSGSATIYLDKDGSNIAAWEIVNNTGGATSIYSGMPCGMINYLDVPTAASHAYKLRAKVNNGTSTETLYFLHALLAAYELP